MIKKTLLLVILVHSTFVRGQFGFSKSFNNIYDITGNYDAVNTNFAIGPSDFGIMAVSWCYDQPSLPRNDYFVVTSISSEGSQQFNSHFYPASSPNDGFTHVNGLLNIDDVANYISGYYYDSKTAIKWPFVTKLDLLRNHLWTKIYPTSVFPFNNWSENKISFIQLPDDPDKFFIVSCAASDLRPHTDEVVNITKIDADGTVVWNKKYYDSDAAHGIYRFFADIPGDIAYSRDHNAYMITGRRQHQLKGEEELENKSFYFAIDKDGNMVADYKTVKVPGIPFGQDIIYDPFTKNWVSTFTHANTDFAGDVGVNSGIGLITLDIGSQIVNLNLKKFYWNEGTEENHGISVSMCNNGDYLLGCQTSNVTLRGKKSPALLKLDNSGTPIFFNRYAVYEDAFMGYAARTQEPWTTNEEYVFVATQPEPAGKTYLKAVRTDYFGVTCEFEEFTVKTKETELEEKQLKYEVVDFNFDVMDYTPIVVSHVAEMKGCEISHREKSTGINPNASPEKEIMIHPNHVSLTNPVLKVSSNDDQPLMMCLQDVNGKLILNNLVIAPGENFINFPQTFTKGIYTAIFADVNKQYFKTERLILTD